MKKLKFLSLLVFSTLFLTSCEKPENEENKPEEPTQEVTAEPRIDLIKKVIRYNTTGGIEDSVLFKYDSQNRVVQVKYGPLINGQSQSKINFSYLTNSSSGSNVIIEQDSAFHTSDGQYNYYSAATYNVNVAFKNSSYMALKNSGGYYIVASDSLGFVKSVIQRGYKQSDWFMDIYFKSINNNLVAAYTISDPMGTDSTGYEYYPEMYNHDLYFNFHSVGVVSLWNGALFDIFNLRHSLLGKRNANLLKKQTTKTGTGYIIKNKFEYEFNSLGLVSKIKIATVSTSSGSTPMATRYEIFYY